MYRKIPEILETIEETLKSIFYKIIFKNSYYTKKNAGTAPALILRKINGAVLANFFCIRWIFKYIHTKMDFIILAAMGDQIVNI